MCMSDLDCLFYHLASGLHFKKEDKFKKQDLSRAIYSRPNQAFAIVKYCYHYNLIKDITKKLFSVHYFLSQYL